MTRRGGGRLLPGAYDVWGESEHVGRIRIEPDGTVWAYLPTGPEEHPTPASAAASLGAGPGHQFVYAGGPDE